MMADALARLSSGAYLGLVKTVRSPAPASSMPATREISISPSPCRRHSRRSAMSRSFNAESIPSPRGDRAPLRDPRDEPQLECARALVHLPAARLAVECDRRAELRERGALFRGP